MSDKSKPKCCYCGRETSVVGQRPHQERCLFGPMGERVKEFARKYVSEHGRVSTREWEASQERRDLGLPTDQHITRTLGSWPKFIVWCGIKYERKQYQPKRQNRIEETLILVSERMEKRRRHAEEAERYYSEPQFINRGVRRIYNWRTMQYEDVHVMEWR